MLRQIDDTKSFAIQSFCKDLLEVFTQYNNDQEKLEIFVLRGINALEFC